MTDGDRKVGPPASDRGVYGISVAAELSGINEQSLRLYEREGLLTPARSAGGTRRYSGHYGDCVRRRLPRAGDGDPENGKLGGCGGVGGSGALWIWLESGPPVVVTLVIERARPSPADDLEAGLPALRESVGYRS